MKSVSKRRCRVNNQRTYTYVPNAEEINARFGSNETGWLFEESNQCYFLICTEGKS